MPGSSDPARLRIQVKDLWMRKEPMGNKLMDPFPTLATSRLFLSEPGLDDAEAVFAFRSDEIVQRYNGGQMTSRHEAVKLIEELQAGIRDGTKLHWGVSVPPQNTIIGLFGYANWAREHRRAEIGYCLHRDFWGRGFAIEALEAIIEYGFQSMDLNRIYACPWAENIRSIRLLEKTGFSCEGVLREEYCNEGSFHDEAIYALLRRDHEARRNVS